MLMSKSVKKKGKQDKQGKPVKKDKSVKKGKSAKKDKLSSPKKKCNNFCQNDYAAELYKQNPSNYETKTRQRIIDNQVCKKIFCDEDCKGPAYQFHGNTLFQTIFRNKLNKGFIDEYSPKEVEMLKKRGALSGCANPMKSTNPLQPYNNYDIFHK
jgi:hypothetical protein